MGLLVGERCIFVPVPVCPPQLPPVPENGERKKGESSYPKVNGVHYSAE